MPDSGCSHCRPSGQLDVAISMAFQPIVNYAEQSVFGYEALVRGKQGEGAGQVLAQITEANRYQFDQQCRVTSIELAARLQLPGMLSINFLPNAIYQPERCIRTTLAAAETHGFPLDRIMFEFTEVEQVRDTARIRDIVNYYKSLGFKTATDDFGSGYSGLNLLADFQTNLVKFDMALIRSIDADPVRQAIIRNCLRLLQELAITPLAEGIETPAEARWLADQGVELMQGYLFARPAFEALPDIHWP